MKMALKLMQIMTTKTCTIYNLNAFTFAIKNRVNNAAIRNGIFGK